MLHPDPTTGDPLHAEAVALATDVASLLVSLREKVRPEHAYVLAMECVRAPDRLLKARREEAPRRSRAFLEEARTALVRAMIALDRAGAHAPLPREEVDALHRRLHRLALSLGALARRGDE